nr:hypothetical protein [Mesorhizobium sp.]
MTRHVVMFSGGGGSWAAARRVVDQHGTDNVTLLFTDTLMEDEDCYRFLIEGAADVLGIDVPSQMVPQPHQFPDWTDRPAYKLFVDGLRREFADLLPQLAWIARGGDIWDVFRHERFLGNSSADPCSKLLKRQMADARLKASCDPASTTVYVGIDKFEEHRFDDGDGGIRSPASRGCRVDLSGAIERGAVCKPVGRPQDDARAGDQGAAPLRVWFPARQLWWRLRQGGTCAMGVAAAGAA